MTNVLSRSQLCLYCDFFLKIFRNKELVLQLFNEDGNAFVHLLGLRDTHNAC